MKRVPWKVEMAGPVPGSDVCSEMLLQPCRKEGCKKDVKKTALNIENRISGILPQVTVLGGNHSVRPHCRLEESHPTGLVFLHQGLKLTLV